MALPAQTFATIQQLDNYTNTKIVPNAKKEIDATELNNILNGLSEFIVKYGVNSYDDGADIITSGGAVTLQKPINVISNVVPTSITWGDNIQKEYYITNMLAPSIPLLGVSYIDNYSVVKTTIPGRAALHIAQATNGSWIQVATPLPGGGGSGGGGNGQGNLF